MWVPSILRTGGMWHMLYLAARPGDVFGRIGPLCHPPDRAMCHDRRPGCIQGRPLTAALSVITLVDTGGRLVSDPQVAV
jgi:hypothetical protein